MTDLQQLQAVLERERTALVTRDWDLLGKCNQCKEVIAERLATQGPAQGARLDGEELRQLRRATQHNARLASSLGQQLGAALRRHNPAATYSRRAQLVSTPWAILERRV